MSVFRVADAAELAKLQARMGAARLVKGRDTQGEPMGPKPDKPKQKRMSAPRSRRVFQEPEAAVMKACQRILESHPKVAAWWRCNTGAMKMDNGRYVKFAFVGASDLMGFTRTGRFLAVECKATGKRATDDQKAFLDAVNEAGGLGLCVDHPGKLALALRAL